MASASIEWPPFSDFDAGSVRYVDVGHRLNESSAPDALCLLRLDGAPRLCVRLRRVSGESCSFRGAKYWHGLLVVGWGHAVYVIDVDTLAEERHELGTYFGCLYTAFDFGRASDFLLIASAERVLRLNHDGTVAWLSDAVGIDGVIVNDVFDDVVSGEGEWDPPGGWRPFRLRLTDGRIV